MAFFLTLLVSEGCGKTIRTRGLAVAFTGLLCEENVSRDLSDMSRVMSKLVFWVTDKDHYKSGCRNDRGQLEA